MRADGTVDRPGTALALGSARTSGRLFALHRWTMLVKKFSELERVGLRRKISTEQWRRVVSQSLKMTHEEGGDEDFRSQARLCRLLLNSIDDVPASLEEADQNGEAFVRRSLGLVDARDELSDLDGPLVIQRICPSSLDLFENATLDQKVLVSVQRRGQGEMVSIALFEEFALRSETSSASITHRARVRLSDHSPPFGRTRSRAVVAQRIWANICRRCNDGL